MKRTFWRAVLRLRFALWQNRRHDRLVLERGFGFPLVVLPGVFNPTLFLTTGVVIDHLTRHPLPRGCSVLDLGTGSGALAVAEVLPIASQIAEALEEAHGKGIMTSGVGETVWYDIDTGSPDTGDPYDCGDPISEPHLNGTRYLDQENTGRTARLCDGNLVNAAGAMENWVNYYGRNRL